MAVWPTLLEVRDWVQVPRADLSDDQLQQIVDAEKASQAAYLDFDLPVWDDIPDGEWPYELVQALFRRCARAVAARGLPLGTLPTAASGVGAPFGLTPTTLILPRLDNEVERYEGAFRKVAVA